MTLVFVDDAGLHLAKPVEYRAQFALGTTTTNRLLVAAQTFQQGPNSYSRYTTDEKSAAVYFDTARRKLRVKLNPLFLCVRVIGRGAVTATGGR